MTSQIMIRHSPHPYESAKAAVYEVRPCTSPLCGSFVTLNCLNSYPMNLSTLFAELSVFKQ